MHFYLTRKCPIIVIDQLKGGFMSSKYKELVEQWESFDDSPYFKKSIHNDTEEKLSPEVELHNDMDMSYKKTLNTIKFFVKSHLGRFKKSPEWKVEVWIKERNSADNKISCAVALRRVGGGTIYAKKVEGSISRAVSTSLKVIENAVAREREKWRSSKLKQEVIWR